MPGSPKPQVLVLASTYPRWAGDREPGFVHELAKRLAEEFHVIALCPHAAGAALTEVMDGVEVIRYRYAPEGLETLVNDGGIVTNLRKSRWKLLLVPGFVLMQAWHAWRLSRKRRIDLVHAHWLLPQGLIAALLGKPLLVTSHGADLYALRSRPLQALKRFVLRKARAATVVSSPMRRAASELGADDTKISVVPMGVDMTARFVPSGAAQRSDSELLFVGRLVEKKGLRHLLQALPAVVRARPDVTLSIAGFGPEEEALRTLANSLDLQGIVTFLGAVGQHDLPKLYQRAALFVAPFVRAHSGDQEGLGLVLVEAIGCGCPVLAGDVPAVGDVLPEAWQVNVRDTAKFSERILLMLSDVSGSRHQVQALREDLLMRLSWDRVAERYAKLLRAIQGQN